MHLHPETLRFEANLRTERLQREAIVAALTPSLRTRTARTLHALARALEPNAEARERRTGARASRTEPRESIA